MRVLVLYFFSCFLFIFLAHKNSSLCARSAENNLYNLSDLTALYQQGEDQEFIKHAKDVKPAERQESWKKMVRQVALRWLATLGKKNFLEAAEIEQLEEFCRWPINLQDPEIQKSRGELILRTLEKNLAAPQLLSPELLLQQKALLQSFWQSTIPSATIALRVAKLIEKTTLSLVDPHAFLAPYQELKFWLSEILSSVYKSDASEAYCQDEWIAPHLWEVLKNFALKLKRIDLDNFDVKLIEWINWKCWLSFRPTVIAKSRNFLNAKDDDRTIALNLLALDKTLPELDKSLVFVLYLLDHPSKSDLYNLAWNHMNVLALQAETRMQLLDKLKNIDPLPDQVFAHTDPLVAKEIIKLFAVKFPEYLSHYSITCLNYLQGKPFPQGNPTMNCLSYCQNLQHIKISFFQTTVFENLKKEFREKCQ